MLDELPENTRNGIAIGSLKRAVGERKGTDRAQDVEAVPDPELVERPRRRRFSAEYKLAILREADGCSKPGEIGALLRREEVAAHVFGKQNRRGGRHDQTRQNWAVGRWRLTGRLTRRTPTRTQPSASRLHASRTARRSTRAVNGPAR